jgi:hypothetical protein
MDGMGLTSVADWGGTEDVLSRHDRAGGDRSTMMKREDPLSFRGPFREEGA